MTSVNGVALEFAEEQAAAAMPEPILPDESLDGAALAREHAQGQPLKQEELDWLETHGVAMSALVRSRGGRVDHALVDDVTFLGAFRFEFKRYGLHHKRTERAMTFVARDESGEIVDIVAFNPRDGGRGSWLGRVAMLGEEELGAPRLDGVVLVHFKIIEWLRASRRGVLVVDADRAGARLLDESRLLAAKECQDALRKILTRCLPRVGTWSREENHRTSRPARQEASPSS